MPEEPLTCSVLINPASITVSPLCTATSVCSLRLSTAMLPPMFSESSADGELTSWVMSRNTMPLLDTRGFTLRLMPVWRNCTLLTVLSVLVLPLLLMMVLATGICVPESKFACTLLRTKTDGADNTRTSEILSSVLTIACALGPRKVKLPPPVPVMLVPELNQPLSDGVTGGFNALSALPKNQLTP